MKKFKKILLTVLTIEFISLLLILFIKITRNAVFLFDYIWVIGSVFMVLSIVLSVIWFIVSLLNKQK